MGELAGAGWQGMTSGRSGARWWWHRQLKKPFFGRFMKAWRWPQGVPAEGWQRVTIADSPGLLLNDNTGLGSAAIWQRDGRIFGIAGAMKARELQRVAESLR